MELTFTANDAHKLTGITAARNEYNASLPQTVLVDGVDTPNPALLATDQEYVQFVMDGASQSYATHYGT